MVWGCFSYKGVGKLYQINGMMDSFKYRNILSTQMFLSTKKLFGSNRKWIFMHDNDPKHKSKLVKKYLENKKVRTLDWLAQSPDLNPIENLWADLKRRLMNKKPNTTEEMFGIILKVLGKLSKKKFEKFS